MPQQQQLISYFQSLSDQTCGDIANATFNYRTQSVVPQFQRFTNKGSWCNVATVKITFADGTSIIKTAESRSEKNEINTDGHSERRALALAINRAINDKRPEFSGLIKINSQKNLEFTQVDLFPAFDFDNVEKYTQALNQDGVTVQIYTERQPCQQKDVSTVSCEQFLKRILPDNKHSVYFLISHKNTNSTAVSNLLQSQYEEAALMVANDITYAELLDIFDDEAPQQETKEKKENNEQDAKKTKIDSTKSPEEPIEYNTLPTSILVHTLTQQSQAANILVKQEEICNDPNPNVANQNHGIDIPKEKEKEEKSAGKRDILSSSNGQSSNNSPENSKDNENNNAHVLNQQQNKRTKSLRGKQTPIKQCSSTPTKEIPTTTDETLNQAQSIQNQFNSVQQQFQSTTTTTTQQPIYKQSLNFLRPNFYNPSLTSLSSIPEQIKLPPIIGPQTQYSIVLDQVSKNNYEELLAYTQRLSLYVTIKQEPLNTNPPQYKLTITGNQNDLGLIQKFKKNGFQERSPSPKQ